MTRLPATWSRMVVFTYSNLFDQNRYSTTDSLFVTYTLFSISKTIMGKKCFLPLLILRLLKSLWRNRMHQKLLRNEISCKRYDVISNMYNVNKSRIVFIGQSFDDFPCNRSTTRGKHAPYVILIIFERFGIHIFFFLQWMMLAYWAVYLKR